MIIKTYEDCLRAARQLEIANLEAEEVATAHDIEPPHDNDDQNPAYLAFLESRGPDSDERLLAVMRKMDCRAGDLPEIAARDAARKSDGLLDVLFSDTGPRQEISAVAITLPTTLSGMGDDELRRFFEKSREEWADGDFLTPSHDLASVQMDAAIRELCRRLPEPA